MLRRLLGFLSIGLLVSAAVLTVKWYVLRQPPLPATMKPPSRVTIEDAGRIVGRIRIPPPDSRQFDVRYEGDAVIYRPRRDYRQR